MIKNEALYKCGYCGKKYKREKLFLQHKCKQMIRDEQLRTPIGQAAWRFYQDWMRFQRKRAGDDRMFLNSRYFPAFIKFATFVKQTDLPTPKKFIKLMVTENYQPTMWLIDEVYAIYMEHLDKSRSCNEQLDITLTTLDKVAEAYDCDISEVFDHVSGSEVIELLKQRKLSPFVLIASKKFNNFLVHVSDNNTEQFIILERLIRANHWLSYIHSHTTNFNKVKGYVAKVDL